MLLERRLVAKEIPRDNPRRFFGFDLAKSCEYHMGEKGHDVDNCMALKNKVQNLLDKGILSFKEQPNVQRNPLPTHAEDVNVLFGEEDWRGQRGETGVHDSYDATKPPSRDDVVAMVTPFVINLSAERDQWDYDESQTEHVVIDLAAEEFASLEVERDELQPVVIELPPLDQEESLKKPMADFSTKAVPWDYGTEEVDAVTRSGRCYAPAEAVEKKAVTDEEAKQFLATIKSSEFDVIEQLRKMPAQISLLELFKTSEKHKNALLRVLNEVHVPEDIGDKQLEEFVGSILLVDQISFSEEDLPKEGTNHNKALLISAKCRDMIVPRILLDNGSALNICPLATLHRLGVSEEEITASQSTVRAFDGVRKQSMGEVELELLIGPAPFTLKFQVLDIPSAFNLLLGRPWIHAAVAVPSTLHQMVRFISKKKLVTVRCETDFQVFQDTAIPYVEPEVNEESSYQTLDLVSMVHVPTGSVIRRPDFSTSSIMSSKVLLGYGHVPGAGLGVYAQGIAKPIEVFGNQKKTGLGYQEASEYKKGGGEMEGSSSRGRGRGRAGRGNQGYLGGFGSRSVFNSHMSRVSYQGQTIPTWNQQGLLSPSLEELRLRFERTFVKSPKLLQEEEGAISNIADLFDPDFVCATTEDGEAGSSTTLSQPSE